MSTHYSLGFPQIIPATVVYPSTLSSVSVMGGRGSDSRDESKNSLQLTERDIASKTEVIRSKTNPPSVPVSSVKIIETSRLDKVSDPKLEIKKEATSPNGLYGVSYSLSAPGPGLSNITFPMSIDEGLQRKSGKDAGIYYAMMFGVNTAEGKPLGRGYIGMQPREDGKALIVFSGYGSHFKAPQGRPEFDGVKGASNSTLVDFKFGNKYNLTVEVDPENPQKLKGFIQDVTDPHRPGPKRHVKDIHVDQKIALSGRDTGFVEQYGAKINRSSQVAPTGGSFSAPFTRDDKGSIKVGEINSTGLYGRYKNSITGNQQVTKEAGQPKELKFSFHGVGYEKKG
ncbi:hypothetical protein [Pseudomonas marginalis]|jgi:hypothetical protein|uniref:hypothetical protein n=1 Tax=Pseudomonas marginalis TaxID=298 RepID=UPI00248049EA|nr:hypothetical protein [Pseudomonas marginalis]WGT26189.1 hypothetical protein QGQ83_21270 [Pseudomonas marginalis]